VLIVPQGGRLYPSLGKSAAEQPVPDAPRLKMGYSKNYGVIFCVVLLIIVLVSQVPLRGFWSIFILMAIALFVLIMVLAGWWETFVEKFQLIDIRINVGGYLFLSTVLFVIWAVTVFIFDHRHYLIVTSGQVRMCLAVGAGETVYDTTGMTFQKKQDDLFRHWIVGLGSGDLIIHRTNTNQEIDMPNVLFIGAKIQQIEKLMKEREVV
jgi:FlaA1/EpsC-like NDP-sugar epimerase